jgi:heme-degrading monooxygenase HmoA
MVVASFHLATFPGALRSIASVPRWRRALPREPGLRFGRVLGTGRGRTMTASADLHRWALFATWDDDDAARRFVDESLPRRWPRAQERFDVLLHPIGGRGSWDGVDVLDGVAMSSADGPVAVLTRATVRPRSLAAFLRAVGPVDAHLQGVDGLLAAAGVGERPIGRQATFSLWRDAEAVQRFAYRSAEHAEVVRRTREEAWYGEELFARFSPTWWRGAWDGEQPLG